MTQIQSNDPYPLSDYLLQLKPGSLNNFQRMINAVKYVTMVGYE